MPQGNILRSARWIFKDFWQWHVDNIVLMAESLLEGDVVGLAAIGCELRIPTNRSTPSNEWTDF